MKKKVSREKTMPIQEKDLVLVKGSAGGYTSWFTDPTDQPPPGGG